MSIPPEEQIRELKTRISQAQARAARAQVERENAQAALDRARKALLDEFEVTTPDQAKAKLTELDATLERELKVVHEALAAAS